jgi:hypothetical protein
LSISRNLLGNVNHFVHYAKKQQKEELMKELTAAYEKGDLHTILRLELTWLQKEDGDITTMNDVKLDAYTAALKEQAKELEREHMRLWKNPRYNKLRHYKAFGCRVSSLLSGDLKQEVAAVKTKIVTLREEMETVRGPKGAEALQAIAQRECNTIRALQRRQVLGPFMR